VKSLYIAAWRLLYFLSLPVARQKIRRSRRAYILITHGDSALMIRDLFSDQRWKLPGGGAHAGEAYEQTALRETGEELGLELEPGNLKLLTHGLWRTHDYNCPYQIFLVRLKKRPALQLRQGEIFDAKWMSLADLAGQKLAPEIAQALAAANLRAR